MLTSDIWASDSSTVIVTSSRAVLLIVGDRVIVVADVEAETCWVDVAMSDEEHDTKDWLGKDVEDTVEYSLGVWSNNIATLRYSPGDWVDEPQEHGEDAADKVGTGDIGTDGGCMLASDPADIPGNTEESDHGEDEVAPLVGRSNKGTDQASNDHDLIQEKGVEDGWPRESRSEQKIQKEQLQAISFCPWSQLRSQLTGVVTNQSM